MIDEELIPTFKALADRSRLRIVGLLAGGHWMAVEDLAAALALTPAPSSTTSTACARPASSSRGRAHRTSSTACASAGWPRSAGGSTASSARCARRVTRNRRSTCRHGRRARTGACCARSSTAIGCCRSRPSTPSGWSCCATWPRRLRGGPGVHREGRQHAPSRCVTPTWRRLRRYLVDEGFMSRAAAFTGCVRARSGLRSRTGRLGVKAADLRLDQAVVAVAPSVEHGQPLVLGVHEDEEAVAQLFHLGHRVLLEHRLDGEALDLDHGRRLGRLRRQLTADGDQAGRPAALRDSSGRFLSRTARRSSLSMTSSSAARNVPARALPWTGRPSMTSVTSTMWLVSGRRWLSCDSSTSASLRSSSIRSRRRSLVSGVASIGGRDLEVLALDDRSHALVDSSRRPAAADTYHQPPSVVTGRPEPGSPIAPARDQARPDRRGAR